MVENVTISVTLLKLPWMRVTLMEMYYSNTLGEWTNNLNLTNTNNKPNGDYNFDLLNNQYMKDGSEEVPLVSLQSKINICANSGCSSKRRSPACCTNCNDIISEGEGWMFISATFWVQWLVGINYNMPGCVLFINTRQCIQRFNDIFCVLYCIVYKPTYPAIEYFQSYGWKNYRIVLSYRAA